MPECVVVYWRDIPAQVIVGRGRTAQKRELPARFMEAIDRCAMHIGARDSDAYLAQWRRGTPQVMAGEAGDIADRTLRELDGAYDGTRLAALVAAGGRDEPGTRT